MSREDYEIYRQLRTEKIQQGEERRQKATADYDQAVLVAKGFDMKLVRHSEIHYTLRPANNGWLLNIYPGNKRLYYDRKYGKPPFIPLPLNWSLVDVVKKVGELTRGEEKG